MLRGASLRNTLEHEEIDVTSDAMRHPQAIAVYRVAGLMFALARALVAAARRLDAWLETRRLGGVARLQLGAMSERELRDIGLTRADVDSVARGGSPLFGS